MALTDAMNWVAGQLGALSGVRSAHASPPNKVATDLEAIVYCAAGTVEFGVPGEMVGLHTIAAELLVPLGDLARAYVRLNPLVDAGARALMADPTLGGTVSTYQQLTYTLGPELLGGKQYLVLRFLLVGVKQTTAIAG